MTAENQAKKKRRQSLCVGCGGQIQDQYILRVAPDLEWHASCLKCADCNQYLDESCTCYVRDGKTYCKRDYCRLFGATCARCGQGFSKSDFVMRARSRIYHIECFRCVACSRQLIPGDEFALRDDAELYCKADHELVLQAQRDSPDSENNNNSLDTGLESDIKSEPGDDSSPVHCEDIIKPKVRGRGSGGPKSGSKQTRGRTVLNEKQLHMLQTCYNANPRPDALLKEQLTEMTGLSQRVIRVWFQNKRCKDNKRSLAIKQMQQHQEQNGGVGHGGRLMQGVPMVASSPVRHEGPMPQQTPVEVQSYQAPWKALSDFALQNPGCGPDLTEHSGPFQQLMESFDHPGDMLVGDHGTPPHPGMMYHGDDMMSHPPRDSVSSDFPRTPSELSSPMSL